jgi:hypothetical protein
MFTLSTFSFASILAIISFYCMRAFYRSDFRLLSDKNVFLAIDVTADNEAFKVRNAWSYDSIYFCIKSFNYYEFICWSVLIVCAENIVTSLDCVKSILMFDIFVPEINKFILFYVSVVLIIFNSWYVFDMNSLVSDNFW